MIAAPCRTCGARYSAGAGHCTACHRTFSSDSGFDRHLISRVFGGCHDPATVTTRGGDPVFQWDEGRQLWKLAGPAEASRWFKAASVLGSGSQGDLPGVSSVGTGHHSQTGFGGPVEPNLRQVVA